ncbi:hypothetical protein P3G55_05760 [Leptospira sp. 96542]|nr:hypothetical protein [Leptospira sp. 96542]
MKKFQILTLAIITLSFANCAELFGKKDKDDNNEALLLALFAAPACGQTQVASAPTNGTRYSFSGCSGDATATLTALGFTASNISFNGGLSGTGLSSTLITNASSLSESGNESKASMEITYVLTGASSKLQVIMPAETNFNGPGFNILPTTAQLLVDLTASNFTTAPSWGSSVGAEKTLCLEVHKENADAHIIGWEGTCATVNRGAYGFDQDTAATINGNRAALRLDNVVVKSMTLYNAPIGQIGQIQ